MIAKNYWPHTISLMIFGSIIASSMTIKVAIENPVQDSNLYLNNYHVTDKNINEILLNQTAFQQKFQIKPEIINFSNDKVEVNFNIYSGNEKINNKAEFDISLTRPETVTLDKKFINENVNFEFNKAGRWNIYLKIKIEELTGYFYYELDSRKIGEIKKLDPFISNQRLEKIAQMRSHMKN